MSFKAEVTNICNFRCSYCALRTRQKQENRDIDLALFERVCREMKDAGVEEAGLFYLGESTASPGTLVEALKITKRLGFSYTFLTSNASMADPALVGELMAEGLDSLKWSCNYADEEQFAEIAQVKPKLFSRALGNIKAAKLVRDRGYYRTRLYASSVLYNGEQRERMEALLEAHVRPFVDEHYFLPLYGQMVSEPFTDAQKRGMTPRAGNQGRIGALRDPLPCWSAFTEAHITASGKLSACCFDPDNRFEMGDLNTHSFLDCWNSQKFQALRAAHLKKSVKGTICEGCIAYG